ncbi:uncharacterized protein [Gossypium hirsutum]|uniref:DNA/RNA polymerases superfamily protein n=1 Tax=Gossypium hirsutum TaxID=3635 RepID=A0ABM2ZQL9_GOSHI|nr:uncharacterized protein LOC121214777 [Gossypium hirsutum]
MHLDGNKMYRDLREIYWWPSLKPEITDFVGKYLTCQQVKVEHQFPSGLLHPVKIPLWKWERVTMDFKLAKLYVSEIVRLHGVPVSIISDKDPHFTSRCRILSCWIDLGERLVLSPELISDTEDKIRLIRNRLKMASDRHKSYVDLKRKEIEYSMGDLVFIKVLPWKKIIRFGRKGKLGPWFIGPYHILKRVGPVAYQLELPPELDWIHDVFHVSMLRRYHFDPMDIVSTEEVEVIPDLTFEEKPVQIVDCDVKVLRKKSVLLVKVL